MDTIIRLRFRRVVPREIHAAGIAVSKIRGLSDNCVLDHPVRDGEVKSDAAALGADQDDFRPANPAEIGKRRFARVAPHFPVVP